MTTRPIAFFYGALTLGGTGKVIVELANYWVAQGEVVHVVLTCARGHYLERKLLDARVQVIDLGYQDFRGFSVWRLATYLAREKPRMLLGMLTFYNIKAVAAHVLYRLAGQFQHQPHIRMVVVEHQMLHWRLIPKRRNWLKTWIIRLGYRFLPVLFYRLADARIVVSKNLQAALAKDLFMKPEKISVVYNPVEVAAPSLHATHPWLDEKTLPVVIAVGRLHSVKRLPLLLQAFARLQAQIPARLLLLGDGDERSMLQGLAAELGIAEAVQFAGVVDVPQHWMAKADMLALTSESEGLSIVLVEALASGCPVVSVDCPVGPREVLGEGRYGILVPEATAEALANAMYEVLQHPHAAHEKLALFQREMLPYFGIETVARDYLRIGTGATTDA